MTGDAVWRQKASLNFPRFKSNPKAEGRRRPAGGTPFILECRKALHKPSGSTDLSRFQKELYREQGVGSTSDPLSERHGWTVEKIRSHWNWAPGTSFLNNSKFSITWRLARNALPHLGLNFRTGLVEMPECACCSSGLEETESTPSTTAIEFARSGITSRSGRHASNRSSSCCSTLLSSLTTLYLRFRVRSVWCFSWS